MKKVFLLIFVPALLVALGFAQTPTANINTDQTNIKGCLGGTDGNYTVVEDGTGHIFKITTSIVNLNPHLGHEVNLTGHSASGVSSVAADNSFAVTELNMISEQCAAAAAAPAATVSTPSGTASTPTAPSYSTSTPAETAVIPAVAAAAPALTESTPTDTSVIPSVAAAESDTTASAAASGTVSSARTAAIHATQPSARPRISQATPATATAPAAAATPAEPASTPAEVDATPTATVSAASETPAPTTMKPAKAAWGGSLWLLISFIVLVLIGGALAPLASRWRKRRMLEKLGPQNLSFSHEAPSDQSKGDEPVVRKIA